MFIFKLDTVNNISRSTTLIVIIELFNNCDFKKGYKKPLLLW